MTGSKSSIEVGGTRDILTEYRAVYGDRSVILYTVTTVMMDNTSTNTDHESPQGIVYFDFDGVLSRTSSWRSVHRQLDTLTTADEHYKRYKDGELSYTEWGALDSQLWDDTSTNTFYQAADGIEIIDGIKETLTILNEWRFVTGVVSAGVYQLIETTIGEHPFDFMVANKARIENGAVRGKMIMNVMNDKRPHYQDFADQYDLSLDQSVTVGDSHDDFRPTDRGLNIGFNADEEVADVADAMVDGDDLQHILPVVEEWCDRLDRRA